MSKLPNVVFNKMFIKPSLLLSLSLLLNAGLVVILLISLLNNKNMELGNIIANDQEKIYEKDIDLYLGVMKNDRGEIISFDNLSKEQKDAVIKQIIIKKELLKIAHQKKIDNDNEIAILSQKYKNDLVIQKLSTQMLATYNQEVSEEDIKKYYDNLQGSVAGQKVIKIYHILSTSERESIDVLEKVGAYIKPYDKREDIVRKFSKLAVAHSMDVNTASKGGDLGYILSSNLKPQIQEYLPRLSIYKISKPIKTDIGWHILLATDIKDASLDNLDNMRDKIRETIASEKLKTYIESLSTKK